MVEQMITEKIEGRKLPGKGLLIFCSLLVLVAALLLGGAIYNACPECDTPPCNDLCKTRKTSTAGLTTAGTMITQYEQTSCCRRLSIVKDDLKNHKTQLMRYRGELSVVRKLKKGGTCGVGLEAALASVGRLLVIYGSTEGPHMDLVMETFRSACQIAEGERRLKELSKK